MAIKSTIEWTESTWNPATGCTKVSPGCKHCYAETFAERWRGIPGHPYEQGFDLRLWSDRLDLPIMWKKPRTIFVNSMSDLFHKNVPLEFVQKVFDVMNQANWHTYQILTKRSERLLELDGKLPWARNIWMGVSVENGDYDFRIDHLRRTCSKVKFLSLEPLLGPLTNLKLKGIDWVIVGGESGPGARLIDSDWILDIRDQCLMAKVPFFFKQWGGVHKKRTGRLLEGRMWDEMPVALAAASEAR
ncbi:MAG: phage Gp37/Gp68 family protein [Planctomycetota bacterium]